MKYRQAMLTTTVLLVGALWIGVANASAPPRTIRLYSATYALTNTPAPPSFGLSRDKTPVRIITEKDRLYNMVPQFGKKTRELVGNDRTVEVRFRSGRIYVGVVTTLPDGMIYVHSDLKQGIAQLTGGTGRYARARGTLEIRDLPVPGLASNVYRVR